MVAGGTSRTKDELAGADTLDDLLTDWSNSLGQNNI